MINLCHVIVGQKGTGKSTFALACADAWRGHAFVLVHDPAGKYDGNGFPDYLPHRELRHEVRKHDSLGAARAAMTGSERCIECVTDSHLDPVEVLDLAERIADFSLRSGGNFPCVLVLDEAGLVGTLADTRARNHLEARLQRLVFIGRHLNVGIIFVTQNANLIDHEAVGEATRITVFRTTNEYCLRKLRDAGNFPAEELERAKGLRDHDFVDKCMRPA